MSKLSLSPACSALHAARRSTDSPLAGRRRSDIGSLLGRATMAALGSAMLAGAAHAQITTESIESGVVTPAQMASTLAGDSITVSNVTYNGAPVAAGLFANALAPIGIETGVILSSGAIANVVGPNNDDDRSLNNGRPGDADLDGLVGGGTLDAASLEFDFVSPAATISFRYVFGSEEYNEFVNTEFNDVFALFVNGVNCAMVPGTSQAVSINTVNLGLNSVFFVNNSPPTLDTQLDGLTTMLQCEAVVVPGATNRLKLVIADRADRILDSAIFFDANSLVAGFAPIAKLVAVPDTGTAPLTVSFLTAGSGDQDGPLASHIIDFGDGSVPTSADGPPPPTIEHSYTAAGTYTAQLTVTDSDGNTATATATVEVQASTDLAIVKSATQGSARVGDNITYTLVATNNGPSAATGVVVTDTLPAGLGVVSANATQGSCSVAGSQVSCAIGTLPPGGLASITLIASANAAGIVVNTASIGGVQADPLPANNSSSATVAVVLRSPTLVAEPAVISALPGLQLRLRFEARLSDGGAGVAGRSLVFTAGGQNCTSTTDANGVGGCNLTVSRLLATVFRLGYTARFDGDAVYSQTSDRGPIAELLGISLP